MVALTVVMLVAFLALLPLRVAISFRMDFNQNCLYANASLFWLPLFKEKFSLQGRYLVCEGTVATEIDLLQLDTKKGSSVLKAVVFDSVNLTFALDYTKCSPLTMLFVEGAACAATAVACATVNCRVGTSTCFSTANSLFGEAVVSVTLAEMLIALAR